MPRSANPGRELGAGAMGKSVDNRDSSSERREGKGREREPWAWLRLRQRKDDAAAAAAAQPLQRREHCDAEAGMDTHTHIMRAQVDADSIALPLPLPPPSAAGRFSTSARMLTGRSRQTRSMQESVTTKQLGEWATSRAVWSRDARQQRNALRID